MGSLLLVFTLRFASPLNLTQRHASMINWRLPINIFILFLIALSLGASISWSGADFSLSILHGRNLALLFVSAFVTQFLIRRFIEPTRTVRFEHQLITTLILFLLFDPTSTWWTFPVVRIVTELAQYFFRTPGGPLFNPAALGTVVVSFFGLLPSWWGTNPAPRILIAGEEVSGFAFLTLIAAGSVAYRYRKLPAILSAFLLFALGYFILLDQSPLYMMIEGTLLFFFLVMLTEPKTSPVVLKEQFTYGSLVGLLVPIGLFFHVIEAYLLALLAGNLYTNRRFLLRFVRNMTAAREPS